MSEETQTPETVVPGQVIPQAPEMKATSFKDSDRWQLAEALSNSSMVPKAFQGKPEDLMIAIDMSERTGMAPMAVVQNIHIIHGRPSWSASFLIACINASGLFKTRLQWELNKEDRSCFAFATDRDGQLCEGPKITIEMAIAEGWATKAGSKWKTMPELMLRYRAATFFARCYCPEVTMGLRTADEMDDIDANRNTRNITPTENVSTDIDPLTGGTE